MPATFNIAILISGRGSNMQAILEKLSKHKKVAFKVIISDNKKSTGLSIAKQYSIPTVMLHRSGFDSKKDFDTALLKALAKYQVNLIVLAGFMTILSSEMVTRYPKSILNIHPSLLPKYKGLNTHDKVIANGDKETGATVHLIDEGVDTGKIIRQKIIKVETQCTAESLAEKLLPHEHQLYSSVIEDVLNGDLNLATL